MPDGSLGQNVKGIRIVDLIEALVDESCSDVFFELGLVLVRRPQDPKLLKAHHGVQEASGYR